MIPQAVCMPKLDIEVNHTSIWLAKPRTHREIARISVVDIRNSGSQNMYLHYLRCSDSSSSFPLALAVPRKLLHFTRSLAFSSSSLPPTSNLFAARHRQYIDAGVTYEHHCFPKMNTHMSISSFFVYTKHGSLECGVAFGMVRQTRIINTCASRD